MICNREFHLEIEDLYCEQFCQKLNLNNNPSLNNPDILFVELMTLVWLFLFGSRFHFLTAGEIHNNDLKLGIPFGNHMNEDLFDESFCL